MASCSGPATNYEPATGRLETVTIAAGVYAYGYHTTTDPQTGEAAGQLATLTAPGGQSLAYSWDGTLPTETTWSGPVAGSVARSFDDDFRVETESVSGGHTVTYEYDPDSLVTRVDQASGPDLDLQRNAGAGFGAGLLTGTTQGVIATTETPSPFGELESLVATENSNPLYTLDVGAHDALGRIETKIETLGAGSPVSTVYTYDAAGRLDTVTVDSTLVADYAYDTNGNRTHEREDQAGPPIAVYDDQDRLLSYAGTTYTYSAAGDLETSTDASGTTTYGYDPLGNLRSVVLPDGEQIEYGIDGQNRRVAKKVCPAPCTPPATPQPVQGFLYGDQLRIVAELDASNNVVSRFVYATRPNVPDFLVKGGVTYRILSDQVGSVRLVVNTSTGAIAQRIDYDAFGNVLGDTNPGFQPFGFAGGLTDADTGLVRFGARDYDPRVGRWTSKDRAGVLLVNNLFAYASLDPINRIDATGTLPQDIDDAVNWARANYPPLAKPLSRVADLPASGALGALGIEGAAVGSTIYLDPKYRTKCLSESERNELHNLILHELLHLYVNQQVGTWRYLARNHALTDQPDHNWIYDQAARINNWRLGIGPVGMPKPALGKPPSAQD